jgi:tetratricopeptide (TPR) repeat protein
MADAGGIQHSYRAFISYAHADERAVGRLHRALERYSVPRALVGREGLFGAVPRRVAPIFRDRDELAASGSLSGRLEDSLAASMFLIVACSPASAQSRWVATEIETFLRLRGADRILAIIVGGALEAPVETLFPPPLAALSPIAADARVGKDGERTAFLKLTAGLLGVGLDDLVQRDSQRRVRQAGLLAGGSTALAAGMAALALVAVGAQREAERQRDAAEGLIEFMLTDLRSKLEPVGRLDVLDSVGERALAYYQGQRRTVRNPESLGRRSRALLLIGEVASERGNVAESLAAFREAAETTKALMQADPGNGDRIYDHNAATFWVGYVAWQQRDLASARTAFEENLALTTRLEALDPANMEWRREHALSHTNLGVLALDEGRAEAALPLLAEGRRITLAVEPRDRDVERDVANTDGWIANGLLVLGRLTEGEGVRLRQIARNRSLDPEGRDLQIQRDIAVAYGQLGDFAESRGDLRSALDHRTTAGGIWRKLLAGDPQNAFWRQQALNGLLSDMRLQRELGREDVARTALAAVLAEARALREMDPENREWLWTSIAQAFADAASMAQTPEERAALLPEIDSILALELPASLGRAETIARARLWMARARLVPAGEREAAWQEAGQILEKAALPGPRARLLQATVAYCLGRSAESRAILGEVSRTEYRPPSMTRLSRDLATGTRLSCAQAP